MEVFSAILNKWLPGSGKEKNMVCFPRLVFTTNPGYGVEWGDYREDKDGGEDCILTIILTVS